MMYKILLVEDDWVLAEILIDFFHEHRFLVLYAKDGESAISMYEKEHPHLILLDIILPKKNGFEVIAEIRAKDYFIPIILMTGTELDPNSEIMGYNLGAVYYLRKPVLPDVVLAQVQRLLLSLHGEENYTIGNCHISLQSQQVKINGVPALLREKDIQVLSILLKNQSSVVPREHLMRTVWQDNEYDKNNKLDSSVSRIRKEFRPFPDIIIDPVYGEGYILRQKIKEKGKNPKAKRKEPLPPEDKSGKKEKDNSSKEQGEGEK